MIYALKIIGLTGILVAVFLMMSRLEIPPQLLTYLSSLFTLAYQWNHIVDINTLIFIATIIIHVEGALLIWKASKYLVTMFQ